MPVYKIDLKEKWTDGSLRPSTWLFSTDTNVVIKDYGKSTQKYHEIPDVHETLKGVVEDPDNASLWDELYVEDVTVTRSRLTRNVMKLLNY